MESSILYRLATFIKESYTKRIKEVASGLFMGGFGGYNIFFADIPEPLKHTWIGTWLWVKTIFFAFTSSLATAYGAYIIENFKKKRNAKKSQKKRQNSNKAA